MNVSLICACKNRNAPLQISLTSWLLFDQIKEIIIVDWSSDNSIEYLTELDSRIKVITVSDQKYFNQPQPLNLAVRLASSEYILKVDTDYILSPYFNFFDTYKIDENSFLCGQNDYQEFEINSSPYFKYLRGLLFVSRENYLKVGGYNEIHTQYYAYEDDDIAHRLELIGLKKQKLLYNHTIIHIPHSDKKRIENFEAYHIDKQLENDIRKTLSLYYSGDELEYQIEYEIAQRHIEINKQKSLSETTDYQFKSNINWKIIPTGEQTYMAKIESKENILNNFPRVYCVSLEESIDRQKNIEKQFLEYGISANPIISKRFSESDDIITGQYLHQLNEGTAGCCVSHLKAIKHWYDNYSDENYAFFCEDDLSLETIKYWNFTWEEFVESIPEDADCVQLVTIRSNYDTFELRKRYWDDWSATAYVITRYYAKKIIDTYIKGDTYHLEIPNSSVMPLIENILFTTLGNTYTIPLFVEDVKFESTFSKEQDNDVNEGQKNNHILANELVLNYWKNKFTEKNTMIDLNTHQQNLQQLLTDYSLDPENSIKNFNLGWWYENNGHTAPALSYYLRCAERSDDLNLAYEALIRGSYCYEKQGTRDVTVKSLLQQALCILPNRPEAYFLLSRYSERRQWWQDTYIYADWGLKFANFDLEPLFTDVEYPGYYGLLFEKAISGWWWGKSEECKSILIDLRNNYELSEVYKKSIDDNLERIGVKFEEKIPDVGIKNYEYGLVDLYNANKYSTDKYDLGYLDNFYEDTLKKYKNSPINMLEIGVKSGGSIKLWKDYFHPETNIYAADINYFEHVPGTYSIIGDAYSKEQISKLSDGYFDLIIDDGPHSFDSFVILIQRYFSKLKTGGTLIIEDIIVSSWVEPLVELSESLGYSYCEIIDMTGKQKTQDLLESWKNGLYILKITK